MRFTDALDEYLEACATLQRYTDRDDYGPEWGYALTRKQRAADVLNRFVPGLA